MYVDPGAPWANGYQESFFSRLRDELLDVELFADLREAKALAARWQNEMYQSYCLQCHVLYQVVSLGLGRVKAAA